MHFREHQRCFLELLEHEVIVKLFKSDPCGALCDKYHLANVFQFFTRADFSPEDYTVKNFFLALTLSHDLYDECKMLRDMTMFRYTDSDPEMTYKNYHWARLNLFQRMQFRGLTERKVCQQVCHLLEHDGFCKPRRENHAGIMRLQVFCIRCSCPARFRPTGVRWDVVLGAPWVESPKPFRADPTPQMFFHQRSEANRALVVC